LNKHVINTSLIIESSMKYKIGNKEFTTKKSAETYTRDIITSIIKNTDNNMDNNCIIRNTDIHYQFLVDLLNNHPKKISKIGSGIHSFIIIQNFRQTGYEVNIKRTDNSIESFSWKSCATGTFKGHAELLSCAMQNAIEPQRQEFKYNNPEQICNHCGYYAKCDVDHKSPRFETMQKDFLSNVSSIPYEFAKQLDTHATIFKNIDSDFEYDWQEYHKSCVQWQYLCVPCHKIKTKLDK
jgi:hypothetical protein